MYKVGDRSAIGDIIGVCVLDELLTHTLPILGGNSMKPMSRSWRQNMRSCVVSTSAIRHNHDLILTATIAMFLHIVAVSGNL